LLPGLFLPYASGMRCAVFVVLLAGCTEHGSSPAIDAPPPIDAPIEFDRCESPAGTAAITAAHQDLQPKYARMFAGGIFTGFNDFDGLKFVLRPFFTNEALTSVQDIIACKDGGAACTSVGFVVELIIKRGEELGDHTATVRNSASTWQASGTLTLTDLVYPEDSPGHVAGSIHVESADPQVTIDGSFDHAFCLGLVAGTLR
jgi:hypothetical protein